MGPKSYKNLKIQFDGFTRGLSWKGAYEGIRGQDRIGIWGHEEWIWGLGMAGWSDDIASHSLPATLPSTAKTSTRFLSDYQDQEILRNDISSLDNVPHLVQVWKLLFLEHTSCIWCCMYCYESLISSKWIGNHGYETPLSSMIRDIIMSSWIILWPLFQCCPGLPQTYYLSLIICLSVSNRATFC